jgi:predicted aconitase with swiveling domain
VRFRGRVIQPWTGDIVGDLLITRCRVSFLGDIDLKTGDVVGSDLDVRGMNIHDKVFVFFAGRGSTVG